MKEPVSKTGIPFTGIVGSNPTLSAKLWPESPDSGLCMLPSGTESIFESLTGETGVTRNSRLRRGRPVLQGQQSRSALSYRQNEQLVELSLLNDRRCEAVRCDDLRDGVGMANHKKSLTAAPPE